MALRPVRGTKDLLPAEAAVHRRVIETARNIAALYGFQEMATPIFEFSEVFRRTLGETSDVVSKETYTFLDRGGEEITLRPEFTAGIARAFISGGLSQDLPFKAFSAGPLFRYERPQKGRLRQFHQVNVELIGAGEPLADVEVIALGAHVLEALGVGNVVTLELNSLGDPSSRAAYRDALVAYLSRYRDELSADSRMRLERNPLRILDSKDEGDRRILREAPRLPDYLNAESVAFFDEVRRGLDRLGVAYRLNDRLVRGLDYYTHTAFEFTTEALGAQGAVIAGGRYDGLIEAMGGPPTPGIGWAGGVERLAMLVGEAAPPPRPIAVVPVGERMEAPALELADRLRRSGLAVDLAYRGNVSRRLKRANRIGARVAILLGEEEESRGTAVIRDLDTGQQEDVPLPDLVGRLHSLLGFGPSASG